MQKNYVRRITHTCCLLHTRLFLIGEFGYDPREGKDKIRHVTVLLSDFML